MATYQITQQQYTQQPVSRTYQYRKVMKPMLERKRRARINRCLDDLKDLMVSALQAEGENVAKLEKADILELTVRHLHSLKKKKNQRLAVITGGSDKFREGFTQAAEEVSRCLAATPGVDVALGTKLMTHLAHRLNDLDEMSPLSVDIHSESPCSSPSLSSCSSPPLSCTSSILTYRLPPTPAASPSPMDYTSHGLLKIARTEPLWRPW